MKNVLIFYGLDNFLVNQSVNNYLKEQNLLDQQAIVETYFLAQDNFEMLLQKILHQINSNDLFNQKKVLVINDYDLVFNNNLKLWAIFNESIKNNLNQDTIIILKFLNNHLNKTILNSQATFFLIENYKKEHLRKWVTERAEDYNINLSQELVTTIINKFPNSLSIINNELKKISNLNTKIDYAIIEKFASKYFIKNPYQLINFWLIEDYQSFWWHYRNFWEKINYDKSNLFNILIYQLESMRNIKLLLAENLSYQEIMTRLNISQFQMSGLLKSKLELKMINDLLIEAHEVDFKIKTGKIAKNVAFDLFFLRK